MMSLFRFCMMEKRFCKRCFRKHVIPAPEGFLQIGVIQAAVPERIVPVFPGLRESNPAFLFHFADFLCKLPRGVLSGVVGVFRDDPRDSLARIRLDDFPRKVRRGKPGNGFSADMQECHGLEDSFRDPDLVAFLELHTGRNPSGSLIIADDFGFCAVPPDIVGVNQPAPVAGLRDNDFYRGVIFLFPSVLDIRLKIHSPDFVQVKAADFGQIRIRGRIRILLRGGMSLREIFKNLRIQFPRRFAPLAIVQAAA